MNNPQTTLPNRDAHGVQNQSDLFDAQQGEPIEGSGFETEEPERGFEERS